MIKNKVFFMLSFICIINNLCAKSWSEILYEKNALLNYDDSYKIINEQYGAFVNNLAPVIASPLIKNIDIVENGQPLIDVRIMFNHRIQMLPDALESKPFLDPAYNSGLPNASKMRIDIWHRLEKMLVYLDELAEFFNYKPGTISIKIFEGLRDLKTQEILFQNKFDEIQANNPLLSDEEIEAETAKWVSPVKNNVPVHSTGAAIDIRLWSEETNNFVDLGKFGVIWGTNNEAQTFSEHISDAQKLNRLFLLLAATKAGLINYVYEYWHFSAGDRYAAFWQEKDVNKRVAYYGAIQ
jgi:zinc D-Ala-D-Ala dipeptidase